MKEIPLTQGKVALVDDDMFDYLSQFHWHYHKRGYATSHVGKVPFRFMIRMHREIMKPPEGMQIDHINGDKLDNRRVNLRVCTNAENQHNLKLRSTNSSGFKGVHWDKTAHKWVTRIRVYPDRIFLGNFVNPIDAAKAYDEAAHKYYGEFARTNF
jgi:hypothetical protein